MAASVEFVTAQGRHRQQQAPAATSELRHQERRDSRQGRRVLPLAAGGRPCKSVGLFKVNLEVFAIDPPISRYNFLPELASNFQGMFCCLYWPQIKYFNKRH